jgi:ubiquinone/menaquinone biosynthesis C-methylase UbiE
MWKKNKAPVTSTVKDQSQLNNAQTFSQASDQYAKSRPQYPAELFAYLSTLCPSHAAVWDCATGNGQAAVSLAEHFDHIAATDISVEQIQHGLPHPRVRYSVSPAEHTPFAPASFDLVTVATAFHWFDQPAFFREADRVLKPGGILAIWSYSFFTLDPALDRLIQTEFLDPIDRYWAEGNRQMFTGYADVTLPFAELAAPEFSMRMQWTLDQLLGFLHTWSAVKRFTQTHGKDPIAELIPGLEPLWGKPTTTRTVRMPIFLRVGKKSAQ